MSVGFETRFRRSTLLNQPSYQPSCTNLRCTCAKLPVATFRTKLTIGTDQFPLCLLIPTTCTDLRTPTLWHQLADGSSARSSARLSASPPMRDSPTLPILSLSPAVSLTGPFSHVDSKFSPVDPLSAHHRTSIHSPSSPQSTTHPAQTSPPPPFGQPYHSHTDTFVNHSSTPHRSPSPAALNPTWSSLFRFIRFVDTSDTWSSRHRPVHRLTIHLLCTSSCTPPCCLLTCCRHRALPRQRPSTQPGRLFLVVLGL